jgi:WhiB family transcriptional regulator, redox-sensing transcriptional regulator
VEKRRDPICSNNRVAMDVTREGWWEFAACRGQDASYFFAPSYFEKRAEKSAREAVAKAICSRCLARSECLEFALSTRDPHGVWGGLNEMERRALLRQRTQDRREAV